MSEIPSADNHLPGSVAPRTEITNTEEGVNEAVERDEEDIRLDRDIASYRDALALIPAGNPTRLQALVNLANAYYRRFRRNSTIEDLQNAINHLGEVVNRCPAGHPYRYLAFQKLSQGLVERYIQLSDVEDLRKAFAYHHAAISLSPRGHPNHGVALSLLGNLYGLRYDRFGHVADLEVSIVMGFHGLFNHPPGHPHRHLSLRILGDSLRRRYMKFRHTQDIDNAVLCHREEYSLDRSSGEQCWTCPQSLANSLFTRYHGQQTPTPADDLVNALALYREALDKCPTRHSDHPGLIDDIARALSYRYDSFQETSDLEAAIQGHKEALRFRPVGHLFRPYTLQNLATALFNRYADISHAREDIDLSIDLYREALALRPPGDPARAWCLLEMGPALAERFSDFHDMEDVENAISHYREALRLYPTSHAEHELIVTRLSKALDSRYRQSEELWHLDESISFFRDEFESRLPGDSNRTDLFNCLISRLLHCYGRFEDTDEDLLEALSRSQRDVALIAPDVWEMFETVSELIPQIPPSDDVNIATEPQPEATGE